MFHGCLSFKRCDAVKDCESRPACASVGACFLQARSRSKNQPQNIPKAHPSSAHAHHTYHRTQQNQRTRATTPLKRTKPPQQSWNHGHSGRRSTGSHALSSHLTPISRHPHLALPGLAVTTSLSQEHDVGEETTRTRWHNTTTNRQNGENIETAQHPSRSQIDQDPKFWKQTHTRIHTHTHTSR